MINSTGRNLTERSRYVQEMFTRIAHRYDLMNCLMTGGQDRRWRQEVIRRASLHPGARLLDLGAGTGDLAYQALSDHPGCQVVAADFTLAMMRRGQLRPAPAPIWSAADALQLPFDSDSFDAVVSGFLLRNVVDLPRALTEQRRVLKPGGFWVALDTTRPRRTVLSPFINFHLHRVIPLLGRLLTGQADAYTYLPETTAAFLRAEELAAHLAAAGYQQVGFRRLMAGSIAIHWARK